MSGMPASFKIADLDRAVRGVRKAGLKVLRTEIGKDGKIVLIHSEPAAESPASDFDKWMEQNAS